MGIAVGGVLDVPRKAKGKGQGGPEDKPVPDQYNIRLGDEELARRVRAVCDGLGLDGANLLRMMIRECLPIYEQRVEGVRARKPPAPPS